jgi:tetratricopeptide (TPR) repeat protein
VSSSNRYPLLVKLYLQYLDDENAASFITAVSRFYLVPTLDRLATRGDRLARRGAVLALGFVGGFESNWAMGRALNDPDRVVRILAENGIGNVWRRDGGESDRQQLAVIVRLNNSHRFDEVIQQATHIIERVPGFAEVWNQRAIAHYHLGNFEDAATDCQKTLELNPHQFGAAVGMAHCYLEMGEGYAALESFRRAVSINPNLEAVRGQIDFLEQALEEK